MSGTTRGLVEAALSALVAAGLACLLFTNDGRLVLDFHFAEQRQLVRRFLERHEPGDLRGVDGFFQLGLDGVG